MEFIAPLMSLIVSDIWPSNETLILRWHKSNIDSVYYLAELNLLAKFEENPSINKLGNKDIPVYSPLSPPLTFCGICIKIQFYSMLNNTDKVYDFSDDWDNKYTFVYFYYLEEQSNYRSTTIFHYELVCAGLYKTYYKGQKATYKLFLCSWPRMPHKLFKVC